jgi:NADPH:quinone reductase-like Zn-dependent oxidoreductase
MNAARVSHYGHADVVTVVEVEKPTVTADQVLVEVHSASLNPFDTAVREGYMKEMIPLELPFTIGGDIAGVVSEIGENVSNVAVGDKVYGQANVVAGNSGAFAEFAATSAGQVAALPTNLDFDQAASLPLVGVSALQALTQHIQLAAGQKIFIHGGAGGIGSIAIQLAKHLGAYVATTANGEGIDLVKELGADEVIDYKAQSFTDVLQNYDAVFDTVGGDDFTTSFTVLKEGGIAVSMIAQPNETKATEHGITALMQSTHVTTEALDQLRELIESGVVTPRIGKVFPLAQVQDAFTARETTQAQGKIVLKIN